MAEEPSKGVNALGISCRNQHREPEEEILGWMTRNLSTWRWEDLQYQDAAIEASAGG